MIHTHQTHLLKVPGPRRTDDQRIGSTDVNHVATPCILFLATTNTTKNTTNGSTKNNQSPAGTVQTFNEIN